MDYIELSILMELDLDEDERKVLNYFIKNISVGEIIAEKELRLEGVKDPRRIIRKLMDKGLIEHGEGCYNLAKDLREKVFKIRRKKRKIFGI